MKRQRLVGAFSAQNLCIFCASRIAGNASRALIPSGSRGPRRLFTSSHQPKGPAGSATNEQSSDHAAKPNGQPLSTLSTSEQRERAALQERVRQQHEQAERVRQRQLADAQRLRQQEDEQRAKRQRQREATQRQQQAREQTQRALKKGRNGESSGARLDPKSERTAAVADQQGRPLVIRKFTVGNGSGEEDNKMPKASRKSRSMSAATSTSPLPLPKFSQDGAARNVPTRDANDWGSSAVSRAPLSYGRQGDRPPDPPNQQHEDPFPRTIDTQAAPQSRPTQSSFGTSRYTTQPFDPTQYRPTQSKDSEPNDWQHLRPRSTSAGVSPVDERSPSETQETQTSFTIRRSSLRPMRQRDDNTQQSNEVNGAASRSTTMSRDPRGDRGVETGQPFAAQTAAVESTRTPPRDTMQTYSPIKVQDETDSTVERRLPRTSGRFEDDASHDVEEPAERVLRSRKFADADTRRDKNPRRSRRGNDEEDDESEALREEKQARKAARVAERAAREQEERTRRAENGTPVNIPEFVSVAKLAQILGKRYEHFVSRLQRLGYDDIFPGKILNSETSGMMAMEYQFDPIFESATEDAEDRDLKAQPEVDDKTYLPTRPSVVTIMGHVDHGKTTILDYLRNSSVAAGEAGGITQHIGAFSVPLASSGKTVTFLDTPGHAAFLAMRQRGANVTDIVVLVVAADDSVKPQTLEALKHAKAAGVPMIVAVNKIDKEEADIDRVKQDLARHGVEIEDFGGETQVVGVSGKTGQGMDELEENIVTLSEILDHRADSDGPVEGWILEATTKRAGRVATVLVRRGTLRPGAILVAGQTWARIRTLHDQTGALLHEVGPGMPVEVDGWRDQPAAGDEVLQAPNEQKANDVVDFREAREEQKRIAADTEAINDARRLEREKRQEAQSDSPSDTPAPMQRNESGQMEIPLVIKADVSGSAEAVEAYIMSVTSPLITPKILYSEVGPINESDVDLAATTGGHILAFNLPPNENMKGQAISRNVQVLENNVIYRLLDSVKALLEDSLPPIVTQKVVGEAEIGASFEIGIGGRKKMLIAGCKVRNGVVNRGSRVRVLRGEEKIYDGTITSLKNVKKDVTEMRKGTECGMGFADWQEFEVGDLVQTFQENSERRKLYT